MKTFEQLVFAKKRNGIEHLGIICMQRFYILDDLGLRLNETVKLQEMSGKLEICCLGRWIQVNESDSFPI